MCDVEQIRAELAVLDPLQFPAACRYLQDNLLRAEAEIPSEPEYLEVDQPKPIQVTRKVLVPIHKAPGFNWVGKLLGKGGEHMKQMSSNNKSRIFIFGRGSSKNERQELQMANSGDPQYAHFNECLHVKIETIGAPPIAYERLSNVLKELKELLTLDQEEMQKFGGGRGMRGGRGGGMRGGRGGMGMRGRGGRGGGAASAAGYGAGFEDFGFANDGMDAYDNYEDFASDGYGMAAGAAGGYSGYGAGAGASFGAGGMRGRGMRGGRPGGPMRGGRGRGRGRATPY